MAQPLRAEHWHAMAQSLWTPTRLRPRRLRHSVLGHLRLAHCRAGMEARFQVIKFGGIFICHLALKALVAGLQLCGWQWLLPCVALSRLRQRRIRLLLNGSFSADTPSSIPPPTCTACFQEDCSR